MKKIIYITLFAACTVFILLNSFQIGPISADMSEPFVQIFQNIMRFFTKTDIPNAALIVRKLAHIFEFFMQALFLGLVFLSTKKPFGRYLVYVLFVGLLTACADEFLQSFIIGRSSLVIDIFIDFGGTCIACIICGIASLAGRHRKGARR